jgi:adenosine/AMP kinase
VEAVETKKIKLDVPEGCNIILGMSHFIKTVEDVYEALVASVPDIKFGLGFCESSGPCLVRHTGTMEELEKWAAEKAYEIGAGHSFIIILKGAYPINVLNTLKMIQEICTIYCATANPVEIIIMETDQGRGIIGVVDGFKSKGIEDEEGIKDRKEFLRKIGYKL